MNKCSYNNAYNCTSNTRFTLCKGGEQTNTNRLTLSVSVESKCMFTVVQTPGDLFHTEKNACLLNILKSETAKTGLLACGILNMDKPILFAKRKQ